MVSIPLNVISAAQASQHATGIPASVSIAQWADESAWGQDCTGTFNYFGMKDVGDQPFKLCPTHEMVNGVRVPIMAPFVNYGSLDEAFTAHARELANSARYAAARACLPDVTAFVNAMAPVYSTAGAAYAKTLLEIIAEHRLTQYDMENA